MYCNASSPWPVRAAPSAILVIAMATGGYDDVLMKTWATLQSRKVLSELGVSVAQRFEGHSTLQEDMIIADVFVTFVRELLAATIESWAFFSHRPPFCLLGCLSKDKAVRESTLKQAKALWDLVDEMDQKSLKDASLLPLA